MSDPIYCRLCGSKLNSGSRYCTDCGSSTAADSAPHATTLQPADALTWRVEVPLITNRFIVLDTLLGCVATTVISGALLAAIFGWGGGMKGVMAGLTFAGAMGLFILVMSVFTLVVIFGNRWPLEFEVGEHGVVMRNVSEKAHAIHRLSWILALVTGRPLMAGPGLIAQSREVIGVPWEDVRSVRRYPSLGVIGIRGGPLENVRLYCTPSNYADTAQRVETLVREHAPSAVIV